MITESRIKTIENLLAELQQNFIQTQRNQVPITEKTDDNANKIVELNDKLDEAVDVYADKALAAEILLGVESDK